MRIKPMRFITKHKRPAAALLAPVCFFCALEVAYAAEVRGTVAVDYQGLFEIDGGGLAHPVSVALIPDQGQPVIRRSAAKRRIEMVENRMRPTFLTVQKGDVVEFVNRDPVFHELFSLSPGEPVSVQLGKAGGHGSPTAEFHLKRAGTTHFFCRIHNKSYARIDVVETPYLQTVQPGQLFRFDALAPGQWKLRLASPAAETQWFKVVAMTAPPPLKLSLTSRNGGNGKADLQTRVSIDQLYQEQVD